MSEQGSNRHNPMLDDELKHEAQAIIQGHGPSHVEEGRQSVGYPDDTDSAEVEAASGITGELRESADDVTDSIGTVDEQSS